jgi:hypothetical protein
MSETFSGTVAVVDSKDRAVFKFDSAFAVLDLGAPGGPEGDLRLRGDDGEIKIHLDGGRSLLVIANTAGFETLRLDGNTGDIILKNADCAEEFDCANNDIEPGDVVVLDDGGAVYRSSGPFDKRVVGIVSGAGTYRPGIVLNHRDGDSRRVQVAIAGKAFCKVDAIHSSVGVGDLLTTSPTPGHAMRAVDPLRAFGAIIGKALAPLTGGVGLVPVLVGLK